MNTWYECKLRREVTMENGLGKKVTEQYLVDAMSISEAEARINEEITPFASDFELQSIKKGNYNEVFFSSAENADKWFACRLEFIVYDEASGKEKKTRFNVLLQATDSFDVSKELIEAMKGTIADYKPVCIRETAIVDVFLHEGKNKKSEQEA